MAQGQSLRHTPVWRALHRPILMFGCDRELVMFSILLAVVLLITAASGGGLFVGVFAVVFWALSLHVLRKMAAADPWMRRIYPRNRRYRAYYPARSTPFRRE